MPTERREMPERDAAGGARDSILLRVCTMVTVQKGARADSSFDMADHLEICDDKCKSSTEYVGQARTFGVVREVVKAGYWKETRGIPQPIMLHRSVWALGVGVPLSSSLGGNRQKAGVYKYVGALLLLCRINPDITSHITPRI